jgi:hypothetical protein
MLTKICEHCNIKFTLPNLHQKNLKRRFCGPICSRRWAANNRTESWKEKNSIAKQGENNPMFGVRQTNSNSLANLTRSAWTGKHQSVESNKKRSNTLTGKIVTEQSIQKRKDTCIAKGLWWKPDDPEYLEFKKYRRKVYYWTSKNDLTMLANFDKRSKTEYHLDHKYSISEGFKNKVSPNIIGSVYNLEFLLSTDNVRKGTKCSITLEKLYELFAAVDRPLRKPTKCGNF